MSDTSLASLCEANLPASRENKLTTGLCPENSNYNTWTKLIKKWPVYKTR